MNPIEKNAIIILNALLENKIKQARGAKLTELTKLNPEDVNDAVEHLESFRALNIYREMGCAPYRFGFIMVTPQGKILYHELKESEINANKLDLSKLFHNPWIRTILCGIVIGIILLILTPIMKGYLFGNPELELLQRQTKAIEASLQTKIEIRIAHPIDHNTHSFNDDIIEIRNSAGYIAPDLIIDKAIFLLVNVSKKEEVFDPSKSKPILIPIKGYYHKTQYQNKKYGLIAKLELPGNKKGLERISQTFNNYLKEYNLKGWIKVSRIIKLTYKDQLDKSHIEYYIAESPSSKRISEKEGQEYFTIFKTKAKKYGLYNIFSLSPEVIHNIYIKLVNSSHPDTK